jgi:glutamate formiminotransferase
VGSELIGILPAQALIDVAVYYLGVENFSEEQILENRLLWG